MNPDICSATYTYIYVHAFHPCVQYSNSIPDWYALLYAIALYALLYALLYAAMLPRQMMSINSSECKKCIVQCIVLQCVTMRGCYESRTAIQGIRTRNVLCNAQSCSAYQCRDGKNIGLLHRESGQEMYCAMHSPVVRNNAGMLRIQDCKIGNQNKKCIVQCIVLQCVTMQGCFEYMQDCLIGNQMKKQGVREL